jgi:hypothetical protein
MVFFHVVMCFITDISRIAQYIASCYLSNPTAPEGHSKSECAYLVLTHSGGSLADEDDDENDSADEGKAVVQLESWIVNEKLLVRCRTTTATVYVSMYLCIYVSMYLYIYVSMYLHIYVSTYLFIYASMHLCTSVYMYLYESKIHHVCANVDTT